MLQNQTSTMSNRIKPYTPLVKPVRIAIVGEAPGETEERDGFPFLGASGQELTRMLHDAGINRQDCYITNVFMTRPPANDLTAWCLNKKDIEKAWRAAHKTGTYPFKAIQPAKYIKPEYLFERERLYAELREINANIIIPMGNIATWALLDDVGIKKHRGTITTSPYVPGKILPTYHPAAILRNWSLRTIVVADLLKAGFESSSPTINFPEAEVWIEPSLQDIADFMYCYLQGATQISVDIETDGKDKITCIGFGDCQSTALCIPFVDKRQPDFHYWRTAEDEIAAWNLVKFILNLKAEKILQNGIFDIQHLWRHGCPVRNFNCDTMIKHHSQQPEFEKGLGFLGSIYTNYPSWKHIRAQVKTEKADG